MRLVRGVAWTASVLTYLLITLGGTVLATGSGLSCPDWPLCFGQTYHAGTYHVLLEQFHRFTAGAVSILIVALVIAIIAWARHDRGLLGLAIAAPILLAIQIVLGGLTVLLTLPPLIITAHLGTALAILGVVTTMAVLSGTPTPASQHPARTAPARRFAQLALANALLIYLLMLLGSDVTGSGAVMACTGWPLCTPAAWAAGTDLAAINILHRVVAVLAGVVTLCTVTAALRRWRVAPRQALIGIVVGVLFVGQAVVGALVVLLAAPAFVIGLHLALGTAIWWMLVLLAATAFHQVRAAQSPVETDEVSPELAAVPR